MKQEALKYFTDTYLTSLGLLIFFIFFISVVLWVYRKHSAVHYERMLNLPLQSEGE